MSGPRVVTLCTGNAVRSVMAGFMLEYLSERDGLGLAIATRGTHVIDGQPVSLRTRAALTAVPELAEAPVGRHRSRQLHGDDAHDADLVVAMEAAHVEFVRRHHRVAAARTATLRRLARDLPAGPGPLAARVAALGLGSEVVDPAEDVVDPAGGPEEAYAACAAELWALCQELAPRL